MVAFRPPSGAGEPCGSPSSGRVEIIFAAIRFCDRLSYALGSADRRGQHGGLPGSDAMVNPSSARTEPPFGAARRSFSMIAKVMQNKHSVFGESAWYLTAERTPSDQAGSSVACLQPAIEAATAPSR